MVQHSSRTRVKLPRFGSIYGVDFSGARRAGHYLWVARCEPDPSVPTLRLVELSRWERQCGTAERAPCLAGLVRHIIASENALWGIDAPLGLPLELFPAGTTWADQFAFLANWNDAAQCGRECVRRALELGSRPLIRRATEVEARTPWGCYHYRIVHQMFHGMRDVAKPLCQVPDTAILPFQYDRLPQARRVVVETCPGSLLRTLELPYQNYKQSSGRPLTAKQRRTRNIILDGLADWVRIDDRQRHVIMRDPGGDALDGILAAVGAYRGVRTANHAAIARHARYPHEGYVFV